MAQKTFPRIALATMIAAVGIGCMTYVGAQVIIMERARAYACGRLDQSSRPEYSSEVFDAVCTPLRNEAVRIFGDIFPRPRQ